MAGTEVRVPDIGDFKQVEVIEVLVKPGDAIAKEQSLITLESDKATMEIPSPNAGVVKEMRLKVGDKVSQGSPILLLDAESSAKAEAPPPKAPEAPPRRAPEAPKPVSPAPSPGADVECDIVVLGAGPGGYSAAFRAADLGLKTVLVERYPTLGGVCLNVGCIPSKALLHTAAIVDAAKALAAHGVSFGEPKLDLVKLRDFKTRVVSKLTGGLASMAKLRKVTVLTGIRQLHRSSPSRGGDAGGAQERALLFRHHCRGLAGGQPAVFARRPAHRRLHRRPRAPERAEERCW